MLDTSGLPTSLPTSSRAGMPDVPRPAASPHATRTPACPTSQVPPTATSDVRTLNVPSSTPPVLTLQAWYSELHDQPAHLAGCLDMQSPPTSSEPGCLIPIHAPTSTPGSTATTSRWYG